MGEFVGGSNIVIILILFTLLVIIAFISLITQCL
jgi:hypothetical protein